MDYASKNWVNYLFEKCKDYIDSLQPTTGSNSYGEYTLYTQGEWGKAAQNFMDGFGYMVGAPISAKNEMKRAIGKVEENDISGGVKTILGRREVR